MKKLIIIAVAAILVLSGAVTGVITFLNTPERVVARALAGVAEDLAEREELAPLSKVLTKGSISFELDSETLNEQIGTNLRAEGKFYFSEDAVMLDGLALQYGEAKLTGGVYVDMDRVYVQNSEILGGAWGLERGKLEDEWEDSVFAPGSDSDVELDEDLFNAIKEVMAALDEELDKEMIKDLEKVLDRYTKKAWKVFCENAEFESETDSVRINKERKNARVITITLDDDAVATIVEDMVEYIVEDDDLKDLVVKYGDRFADMLEEYMDIEDMDDMYDDLMDELENNAEDIVDSIEESMEEDIVITVVTPTLSSKLLMLAVEYDDTELVNVSFGHEGLAKSENISVNVAGEMEITYKISENSKDEYKASLEVMGEKVASIKIDKDKESYELELVDLCKVKGDISSKKGTHTITVDSVTVDGEKTDDLGITVVLSEKDKMPAPEKEINSILSLDEEELNKWTERLNDLDFGESAGLLSGSYSAQLNDIGLTKTYTFVGNTVTMTSVTLDGSKTTKMYGTYEIIEGTYGSDKISMDLGYSMNSTITNQYMYLFDQGDGYIKIDGDRYNLGDIYVNGEENAHEDVLEPIASVKVNILVRDGVSEMYFTSGVVCDGTPASAIDNFCTMNGLTYEIYDGTLYRIDTMYAEYGRSWSIYNLDADLVVELYDEQINDGETIILELN